MYAVITVQHNTPLPFGFTSKGEALEFYDAQRDRGLPYTTLWEVAEEGVYNPLDPEAVRHNLKTTGVWL